MEEVVMYKDGVGSAASVGRAFDLALVGFPLHSLIGNNRAGSLAVRCRGWRGGLTNQHVAGGRAVAALQRGTAELRTSLGSGRS